MNESEQHLEAVSISNDWYENDEDEEITVSQKNYYTDIAYVSNMTNTPVKQPQVRDKEGPSDVYYSKKNYISALKESIRRPMVIKEEAEESSTDSIP